jgi:hypothetical protein
MRAFTYKRATDSRTALAANCGAKAAVANAVFNAPGVRVREFPITLEKVLPGLPVEVTK